MIPVRAYWRLLVDYLRPLRARVLVMSVLLLAAIGLQVSLPQLVRSFIDRAVAGSAVDDLIGLAVVFILVALAQQGLHIAAAYFAETVGWTATNELRAQLAEHCLRLDLSFHKRRPPGELIERIDGDVTALSNFFSKLVVRVFGNFVMILAILVLLWLVHPLIGLGLTLFNLAAFAVMMRLHGIGVPWWKAVSARKAEFYGLVEEQLGGTEDIRGNGGVPYMLQRFHRLLRAWLPETVRARHGWSMLWATSVSVYVLGISLVFLLGSYLFTEGALTIGTVYLVVHYTDMIRHPMEQIREQFEDLQKAGAGIARIEDLFAETSLLDETGTAALPTGAHRIELDGVTFAYQDDDSNGEVVLQDVSLVVPAGSVIGVLGRTGSGKSTLARLLTRMYDPTHGEIRLDGTPLPTLSPAELRRAVAMVTQEVQLFRATVRDNLTFFEGGHDDEELLAVVNRLGLGEWLQTLPDGLDTRLESGSGGLSAGEAQLLAFARVFLRDPGLVILDEASSRLDPHTEAITERAVDELMADRTGVIIAHRLATIERADLILILEDGRIVEFGDRVALAADETSRFARLLRSGIEEVLA